MKNINNTFNNYPTSFEQYFDNKPAGMSYFEYFFSIINPYKFERWVIRLIYLIIRLCNLDEWTIARVGTIAFMVGKSKRTVQRTLRPLVAMGLVQERIEGNNRRYKINQKNWDLLLGKYQGDNPIQDFYDETITQDYCVFSDVTPDVTPEFPASHFNLIDYEVKNEPTLRDCNNSYRSYDHQADDLSDPKKRESDKTQELFLLDPIEIEIKQEFEAITGKPLNLKKNRKPLAKLREMAEKAKDVVMLAFSNVANHCAETGTKVYNLAYVLTAAKNLIHPKTTPKKSPQDYVAASEQDKAYASIGGDPAKNRLVEPELSPERKEEENKAVLLKLEHHKIETELFNDLDQQTKDEMIQEEIELIKTQPIWEKIKPQYSWSFNGHIISLAIERIKNYLLQEYLDYQAFLLTQASG